MRRRPPSAAQFPLPVGAVLGGLVIVAACASRDGSERLDSRARSGEEGGASVGEPATGEAGVVTGAGDSGASADAASADASGDAEAGECAPPSDPLAAAVCVTFAQETIAFLSDRKFDGRGRMILEILNQNVGIADHGIVPPILFPQDPDAGTLLDLRAPIPTVRIDGIPMADNEVYTTIYVRALFDDDESQDILAANGVGVGWWLGGYDWGLGALNPQMFEIRIAAGLSAAVPIHLMAVRKVHVTVGRDPTVNPSGNGQGPMGWYAHQYDRPSGYEHVLGFGTLLCGDVRGAASIPIEGLIIGKGPLWLGPWLDDWGAMDGLLPGGMYSEEPDASLPDQYPPANELSYPDDAYQIEGTVLLNAAAPAPEDVPDTVTCLEDGGLLDQ